MTNPQQVQPEAKKPLTEEERKALSHKRIYWAIILLDVALGGLFLYEVIALFIH
jgi:hypothetical protein